MRLAYQIQNPQERVREHESMASIRPLLTLGMFWFFSSEQE